MIAKPQWIDNYTNDEIKSMLAPKRHVFDVAVYSSENYFNFGAIIRISHNFLANKLYAVNMDSYYKKATMSARRFEDIQKVSLEQFLKLAEDNNRTIVAMERRPGLKSKNMTTFEWPENPIMFFGSEKFGVPDEVLEKAEHVVSIPVYGVLHDFNIAVAAGISMYDFITKKNTQEHALRSD